MTRKRSNGSAFALTAVAVFTLGLLISAPAHAQVAGATLTGTVTDNSGAVIPKVQVSIKDVSTGVVRTATTDAAGLYTAPNLLAGTYEVTFSAQGFTTLIRSGITLTVGAQQEMNVTMQVGQVTQKVQVTGEAAAVQLANPTISAVVGSNTVRELPLNGRDWTQLATLQPGVTSVTSLQYPTDSGFERGNRGFGAQMSISGTRPQQNNYRIDGINVNDAWNGSPGSVFGASLGVDAIQEFSVLTSNFTAEYGRTSGGVINAITRSGTNQFHGTAFEFLRNSSLDAANFFDNFTNSPKPPFRRNQFGGSAGGPIRKDRTFIFADYEGLRQNLGVTNIATVPSSDARNGIIHNADGTTSTITVNPLIQPFLPLYALPNGGLLPPGNTGIFSFDASEITTENFVSARADHKISDKDSLSGSWQYDKSLLTLPDALDTQLTGSNTLRELFALEETHLFSPTLVNSFRLGYNRNGNINAETVKVINPLITDLALGAAPGLFAPQIQVPGLTNFLGGPNSATISQDAYNSYQVYDDAFLTKGKQSLKFGVVLERDQNNFLQASQVAGLYKFGSENQFLTNQPKSLTSLLPGHYSERGWNQDIIGGYVQDDIRWRPNLTFNLGLRYEAVTVPNEEFGRSASLLKITDTTAHVGAPLYSNPSLRDFEPRTGFAWDPFGNGKTSVRGGFGIFDVLPLIYEIATFEGNDSPFNLTGQATNMPQGSFPVEGFNLLKASNLLRYAYVEPDPHRNYLMSWNLNVQRELAPSLMGSLAYVGSHAVHQQFRVDGGNMVLPTQTSADYLWPFPASSGTPLNPAVGRIDYNDWGGSSFFDALEAGITKRMSHGFQVQGSYTWGRAIDTGSQGGQSDQFSNSITSLFFFNKKTARALADFNVSQNLVINYTWDIPSPGSFHGPAAWAASGWELGGIITAQSGLPTTAIIGGDPLGLNTNDPFAYPNVLTGPGCQSLVNPGNPNNYIKLNCFSLPMATPAIAALCTPFQPGGPPNPILAGSCSNLLGNSGRNTIIGPGLLDFDFSLFKNNYVRRISETFNVQFRAEFFNVLNRANFAGPVATNNSILFDQTGASVPGAGLLTGTTTTSREVQFAVKVIW